MTEYWVSSKKHYCETCNCWLSGHKVNIKNHEKSARHIENFRRVLNESYKRKEEETKEKKFIEQELKKLENIEKQFRSNLNNNGGNSINPSSNIGAPKSNLSKVYNNSKAINNNNKIHNRSFNRNYTSSNSNNLNAAGGYSSNYNASNTNTWILMVHECTGCLIFFNILTNEVSYEKPQNFVYGNIQATEKFTAENGWFKYFDYNSYNNYYYNIYKQLSIWEYSEKTISNLANFIKICNQNAGVNTNIVNHTECFENTSAITTSNGNDFSGLNNNDPQVNNYEPNNENVSNILGEDLVDKEKGEKKVSIAVKPIIENKKKKEWNDNNLSNDINNKTSNIEINQMFQYDFHDERVSKHGENCMKNDEKKKNLNGKNEMETENNNEIDIDKNVKATNEDIPNTLEQNDESSKPGMWEVVENDEIKTIPEENIEKIFYKIKTKEELENEQIKEIEDNIEKEYSNFNEFYVKKKQLENKELYLNQEFKFVNKPIYKKAIDKNDNKKVNFAKRNIKPKQAKKKIT
ncbi:zinc finger protein, putative [Plasmodium yoelii]|uniref:Zinc finger protein n=3 Tax=Plasmodium yoelii TaxID=5861 RepID=A0AAE9WTC2_PLAYO|nr:zinc finger protein, putative [Plasmodium yoelii]EAA20673.1 hypothetical protein [Plasmodium yoelii yoelii]WBY58220.1 zinc finger protein [Plasmodium yoelii yoelii]CDU85249.1 U1 small nuclear ribonucleoprotein C, putative [Plasmodium yoelii]VTZ79144.1 zinc finger protein, putative [Plasmodium yoelii]|eukprot:XP_729108.1 zinc finger protein, putative [Plasmodium yoelii]